MAIKKRYLKVKWVAGVAGDVDHYIVESVDDSVDYHPGERLLKAEVERLCSKNYWSVSIR